MAALALRVTITTACGASISALPATPDLETIVLDDFVEIAVGQTRYVPPLYSYIFMGDEGRTINLTITMSIRNTN